MKIPSVAVISGGISEEREVSLASGTAVAEALSVSFSTEQFVINDPEVPDCINGEETVVFPALHGRFGEDGCFQSLLEDRDIAYAGSGPEASRICFHKVEAKTMARAAGVQVVEDVSGPVDSFSSVDEIVDRLGPEIVLKPVRQGSSVGLQVLSGRDSLRRALEGLEGDEWMLERKIDGREITVGLLGGECMGIVEVLPRMGTYDYEHKYTPGLTDYRFPAELAPGLASEILTFAERAFSVCGCRDFARADFIVSTSGRSFFLEINTLPGLTETSLMPKSAACLGIDFTELARRLVSPAIGRWKKSAGRYVC